MIDGGKFVLVAQRVKFSRVFPILLFPFKETHCKRIFIILY